jgi:hypothetical protein
MSTYEGLWDCPNCKKVGNRGHDKHCGGCGAPRNPDVEFYLPDDAREVTDEAELARTERGPDWTCAYCQGDNPADSKFCTNCGAGQDGSKPRQTKEERFAPVADPDSDPDIAQPLSPAQRAKLEAPSLGQRIFKGIAAGGCLGCFGLLVLGLLLCWWLLKPHEARLEVIGHGWKRTIQTQQYRQLNESAWENQVPMGARVISRRSELNHVYHRPIGTTTHSHEVQERVRSGTHKVKVGKKNMGNGYFKDIYEDQPTYRNTTRTVTENVPAFRDEPVYGNKVYYMIGRWTTGPPVTQQGENFEPVWPVFQPRSDLRESTRGTEYLVRMRDRKGNLCTYTTSSEQEWRNMRVGNTYHGEVSGDAVTSLKP